MAETKVAKRRGSEATREAILDAAREVFVERGYEGASIRRVADGAGCTHGTIYLHFRDKDDLLYQLSEEHFRQLLARLRALPRSLDVVARVREAFLTVVDYGLEFPSHYHLMIAMRPPSTVATGQRSFGPMAEEVQAFLYDTLARAAERGRVASADIHVDTFVLLAAAHGIIELHRAALCDADEARAAARRAVAVQLAGLALSRANAVQQ